MNLSELTCTTGLLLVTILGGSNLGNGLTIWNLRREELYLNLELILETPFDHVYMLLSLTTQNSLFQFLRVFHNDCRVL